MQKSNRSVRLKVFLVIFTIILLRCANPPGDNPSNGGDQKAFSRLPLNSGQNGTKVINNGADLVNRYVPLNKDAVKGAASIFIDPVYVSRLAAAPGDALMIYQTQGAIIDQTDSATSGKVIDLKGAGQYEFVIVNNINNTTGEITIDNGCLGLKNSYPANKLSQVIWVPQYSTLILGNNTRIDGNRWESSTGVGGVVAIMAQQSITLGRGASISIAESGFSGGVTYDQSNQNTVTGNNNYASFNRGGQKGEGIAGAANNFPFAYSRGPLANGGGGGNAINAGGGGGANVSSSLPWSGQGTTYLFGTSDSAVHQESLAWLLDKTLDTQKPSSGGGRGGYTLATNNLDPAVIEPGSAAWGGDQRRIMGGFGGFPSEFSESRLFLGGGGGAGDRAGISGVINPGYSGGGTGGGAIFIITDTLVGSGTLDSSILASGSYGRDGAAVLNQAGGAGGGGAGGTISIWSSSIADLTIAAFGGNGGNYGQPLFIGPGGGGSGGMISVRGSVSDTVNLLASAGLPGSMGPPLSLTNFPENGATAGDKGIISVNPFIDPHASSLLCNDSVNLSLSLTEPFSRMNQPQTILFNVAIKNEELVDMTNTSAKQANRPSVKISLSKNATISEISPSAIDWKCQIDPTRFFAICHANKLTAQQYVLFSVTSKMTNTENPVMIKAAVSSINRDPLLTNNEDSKSFPSGPQYVISGGGNGCNASSGQTPLRIDLSVAILLFLSCYYLGKWCFRYPSVSKEI